jgi:hypothetical protein
MRSLLIYRYLLQTPLAEKISALIGMFPRAGDQTPLKKALKPPSAFIYLIACLMFNSGDTCILNFMRSSGYPAHVEVMPATVPARRSMRIAFLVIAGPLLTSYASKSR